MIRTSSNKILKIIDDGWDSTMLEHSIRMLARSVLLFILRLVLKNLFVLLTTMGRSELKIK